MRTLVIFCSLLLVSASAYSLPGESIAIDPATGNYRVTYHDSNDNQLHNVTFVPSTKIDPILDVVIIPNHKKEIKYKYLLRSGRNSAQDITDIVLDPVSRVSTPNPDIPTMPPASQNHIDPQAIMRDVHDMTLAANYFDTPPLWKAYLGYSNGNQSFRVTWLTKVKHGLRAGQKVVFGYKSFDLPGIVLAQVSGYAPGSEEIPAEELQDADDGGFGQQYHEIIKRNFVPRPVAVPAIVIGKPFDVVSVLRQLKDNVSAWTDMNMLEDTSWPHIKLIEPTIANIIKASLQTAIDELAAGRQEAAVRTLKSLRVQLEHLLSYDTRGGEKGRDGVELKGHDGDQAKTYLHLAKEVLEFDLKYVCRELGSDEKFDEVEKR